MGRLTERDEHGGIFVKQHDYVEAARKLADYEDTGLTPEEIMDGKLLTGWIPVEERLPEKDARVLAYRPEMCGTDVGPMSVLSGWNCYSKRTDIIAWMPLPDKPEES